MRWISLLSILIVVSACGQLGLDRGMVTNVPSSSIDAATDTIASEIYTPTPSAIPYPTGEPYIPPVHLPNLRIVSAWNTLLLFHCLEAAEGEFFRIVILNDGAVDSGVFVLRIHESDYEVDSLMAGKQITVDVERLRPDWYQQGTGKSIQLVVDPLNLMTESDETDNVGYLTPLVFTPPPHCSPTPTVSPM